jgi:hypothetical protein
MLATLATQAQLLTPEMVVNRMPVITITVCKKEVREQFLKQVYKLKTEVDEEITHRKSDSKDNSKGMDQQSARQMSEQAGVSASESDMKKMKSGKMSKEANMAMVDKMLQQSKNMSVDEAKQAGKMSKEGQKAWAEGMSTEMMADAQTNPGKNLTVQKKNMGIFELAQEQSQLAQKIQSGSQKFDEQLEEFNRLKEKTKIAYEACLKKVDKDFENKVNTVLGDEHFESMKLQRETCYQNFCSFLTPKYNGILLERFNAFFALGDDYNRMDVLSNELASATNGTNKKVIEPGLTYLEALSDYIVHLQDLPAPYFLTK